MSLPISHVILFLSTATGFLGVDGGWANPAFQLLEDGLPEVSIRGSSIHVVENTGYGAPFPLVQLRLTEPHNVTFATPPDPFSLNYNEAASAWYFTANTNTSFDYEALEDPYFYTALKLENGDVFDFLVFIDDEND